MRYGLELRAPLVGVAAQRLFNFQEMAAAAAGGWEEVQALLMYEGSPLGFRSK